MPRRDTCFSVPARTLLNHVVICPAWETTPLISGVEACQSPGAPSGFCPISHIAFERDQWIYSAKSRWTSLFPKLLR